MVDRLLIIDDEDALGQLYSRIGESVGYAVRATADPEVFWDAVEHWSPTVIMIDLRMPRCDGIEVLRGLADRRVAARILVSSGAEQALLESVQRLGRGRGLAMAGAFTKPLSPIRLRDMLIGMKEAAPEPITPAALHAGIERGDLKLLFQPKFDLSDGQMVGCEALVRWQHPTAGPVPPSTFVEIAEANGMIDELTWLVIDKALAQQAAWRGAGLDLSVAINVSPTNLRALDFPDRLNRTCDELCIAPSSITLELTETAAHEDHTTLMDILTRLRLRDLRLSIDDFGTGHSSLFKLHTLPFSELKLDRSFVTEARASKRALAIVKSTMDLAHDLSMKVVAEGIEDEDTATLLQELGCDVGQGFHFSKPVPGDTIAKMMRRGVRRPQSPERMVEAANA